MTQGNLFDWQPPKGEGYPETPGYVAGCDTSQAAAESLDKPTLSRLRALVLGHIAGCGATGCTCDAVEIALNLRHQSASARVRELVLGNLLEDSGERRKTRSGRKARVYVVRKPEL